LNDASNVHGEVKFTVTGRCWDVPWGLSYRGHWDEMPIQRTFILINYCFT